MQKWCLYFKEQINFTYAHVDFIVLPIIIFLHQNFRMFLDFNSFVVYSGWTTTSRLLVSIGE